MSVFKVSFFKNKYIYSFTLSQLREQYGIEIKWGISTKVTIHLLFDPLILLLEINPTEMPERGMT